MHGLSTAKEKPLTVVVYETGYEILRLYHQRNALTVVTAVALKDLWKIGERFSLAAWLVSPRVDHTPMVWGAGFMLTDRLKKAVAHSLNSACQLIYV